MGIIPDTSVLMYFIYGNHEQRKRIQNVFDLYENININQILLSEIGRVIFGSFFKLRNFINSYISKKENLLIDDFWIDMTQKINKIWSNQLSKALISILTYYRNRFDKFKLEKSDPVYAIKREIELSLLLIKLLMSY